VPYGSAGRHRRRRKPLASPATLLGTALGASLAAGVALGSAAAANASHHSPAQDAPSASAALSSPATGSPAISAALSPSASGAGGTELLAGKARPAEITVGVASAVAARKKERPQPAVTTRKAPPAWVDPNPTAVVTSCFGERWGRLHAGVDLAAPDGTPIVAAGAGVVVRAGVAEGYGNAVLIDHGNGFLTHYGHLSAITVSVGQRVAAGEQIGNEGSTGHSTGPHLHFEVHQGYYQNPIEPTAWMHHHGVDISGCVPLS
jgi:murein DD-endopeptidase MepM/ murein hydrolase activator NlpD